jgi:hypothetical protein
MNHVQELHDAGVHVDCVNTGSRHAPREKKCHYAGKIERVHSHEFDGLLVCGCDDLANPL